MSEDDRQLKGQFGFARDMADQGRKTRPAMRLVHARDEAEKPPEDRPAALRRPRDDAAEPAPEAVEERWVVKPKKEKRSRKRLSPFEMKASDIRMPGMRVGEKEDESSSPDSQATPKRWLALALAGMTYVIGLAGLWSMVQGFEEAALLPVTPAGDERTVPPLDETIDVRDAGLDGLILPQPRPDDLNVPSDVADSNLQNQS
jgi:hypothetical protein